MMRPLFVAPFVVILGVAAIVAVGGGCSKSSDAERRASDNATAIAEFDPTYKALRTISVQGQYNWNQQVQTTAGWSKKNFIPQLQSPPHNTVDGVHYGISLQ